MKTKLFFLSMLISLVSFAQDDVNEPGFQLGEGLNFNFQDGDYHFRIGGMMQPHVRLLQVENQEDEYFFNSKRTYLNLGGEASKEKLSFFVQFDFSRTTPLLDAWVGYSPIKNITIIAGQKQNIANNLEMLIMENYLQFPDRSLLSTSFSRTGREFGLFVESYWGSESFMIKPQLSFTSGDGINSFGADSRDVDLGGLKLGGRLDILPFGDFKGTGNFCLADLEHEESPKLRLGVAGSYNNGASDAVGEGHGLFLLYNSDGDQDLPDYRQIYGDLHLKYKGISILAEYVDASAGSLDGLYKDVTTAELLYATEISQFLNLGSAFNFQVGYVTKSGFALDARFSRQNAEFEENNLSLIQNSNALGVYATRYAKGNALKYQIGYSQQTFEENLPDIGMAEFMVQLMF